MDYKKINDYEVLYMIRENSEDARDILYEKYLPILKKLASSYYARNKNLGADYDDYFQEAVIAFYRAISSYDEAKNALFYTYVSSVVRKHLLSFVRSLSVKKNTTLNECSYDEAILYNAEDKTSSSEKEMDEQLLNIKNDFDIKYSTVFELRFNGFSYREIANLLDIPMSTVQSRVNKIKKTLREKMLNAF